jgi:hypothetical protein
VTTPPPVSRETAAAAAVEPVVQPDQPVDAGPVIGQIQADPVSAGLSDAERNLDALLKQAQANYDDLRQQMAAMSRQIATVRQQAGPPVLQLLGASLATRVQSIAAANPDLGKDHFAGVISQSASLADASKDLTAGTGSVADVERLANAVGNFFTRVHPRTSGKAIEGLGAVVDEAERILEEAAKLAEEGAPVALAVAKAL